MAIQWRFSRYESWVHVGFLAIVALLFALNVTSNYVIYKDRLALRQATISHLRKAALGISRSVRAREPEQLTRAEQVALVQRFALSDLNLVPSRPAGNSKQEKRAWLSSVIRRLPPGQLPRVAEKLFGAELNRLTRGDGAEYYYLYPVPTSADGKLLIVSVESERLANYDDTRLLVLVIQLAALGLAAMGYIYLSRYIFKPMRDIKKQAALAGRTVDDSDDTEAIVEEYRAVIDRLRQSEQELLRLNAAIQSKADSLEQFNQYLFESGHAGIITLDPSGATVAINETAIDLFDLKPGQRKGCQYTDLFAGMGELLADIGRGVQHGVTAGYKEYHHLVPDHPDTVIGVTVSVIRDSHQRPVGLLIFANDLTELVRLRRKLESQNRLAALGEMAGGLAHQIRNSLGAISGYGTLLKKRLAREGLPADSAETLLEETREAESLIGRFLSYARPLKYSPDSCSLHALVEDTIRQFRARGDSQALKLKLYCPEDVEVFADEVLLKQVLCNVIDNAANAYEYRQGVIEIRVVASGNSSEICVRDFGCGIPADEQEQIFTPFFSSRPSGTGLGLSLVAKIVELHGGSTRVESEPGRGTRFTVSLPRPAVAPRPTERSKTPSHV